MDLTAPSMDLTVRRILGAVRSILGAVRRILGAVRRILGAVRSILGAVRRILGAVRNVFRVLGLVSSARPRNNGASMFCSVPVHELQLFTLIFDQQRPPYTPTFIPLFRYSVFRVLQAPYTHNAAIQTSYQHLYTYTLDLK